MLLRLQLVLCAGLLGACATGLEYPPAPAIKQTAGFSADPLSERGAEPDAAVAWWRSALPDPLRLTLDKALAANPSLARAEAEVAAAQARLRQAEATSGVRLTAAAGASVQRASADTSSSRALGVDGELPVDISGALAERVRAARYAVAAAEADAAQLESDLARDFLIALLDGAEAEQRHALLLRQLDLAQTLQRLIELRFAQGLASSVDVLQQRDQVAALRQQLPQARLDRQIAANRLREISGRTPEQADVAPLDTLPAVRAAFPAVQPVDLLDRRASLRAGRARLASADAGFAAALADRWPTLSLSAGVLTRAAAGDVSTLISAAIDAALTLFDSGGKTAVAAERRAQLVAAGQQLLSDWLEAVIETDDLIHQEASLHEQIALAEQRLDNAQALLIAARRRYEQGVSDYLPVLEALRGLQQQQRDRLTLQADLARTRVRLHRALGHPVSEQPA